MPQLKTNPKNAIEDMAKALKSVFKDYSFASRKTAWEGLIKGKGKSEVEKLLIHPGKPVNQFKKLSFREWMETQTETTL